MASTSTQRSKPIDVKKSQKRMFGLMLGTLEQFNAELKNRSDGSIKREQKQLEILSNIQSQRLADFESEEQKRSDLTKKRVTVEQDILRDFKRSHIDRQKRFQSFLCTKTNPPIYYLPKKLTPENEETLLLQQDKLKELERLEEESLNNPTNPNDGDMAMVVDNTNNNDQIPADADDVGDLGTDMIEDTVESSVNKQ